MLTLRSKLANSPVLDHERVRAFGRTLFELAVLCGIWKAGGLIVQATSIPVTGGVVGLGLLLLVFATGIIKPASLQRGASLLLVEMLLFFVPASMSLLDQGQMVLHEGWRILLVVMLSTLAVMASTALAVDWICRRSASKS